jgi:hypothetical protein
MRRLAGMLTIAMALSVPVAAALDSVKLVPGSVHHQNVQTAIQFLRDHGEQQAANEIQALLDAGSIYVDTALAENGETSALNNVTLSTSVAGHTRTAALRRTPLDPVKDFREVVELARTLYHENIHANHQSYGGWLLSGLSPGDQKEADAWSKTLQALDRWITVEQEQFDLFYNPKTPGLTPVEHLRELEKIKTKLGVLKTYFGDYHSNNYFGRRDAVWVGAQLSWINGELDVHLQPKIDQVSQAANAPPAPPVVPPVAPAPSAPTAPVPPEPPAPLPVPAPQPIDCLPCRPIAESIAATRASIDRLTTDISDAKAELARVQQRVGQLERQIQGLERQLQSSAGTGGRSFDPATGITINAWDQGNGTVRVTVTDAAGTVIEDNVRDGSAHKAAVRRRLETVRAALATARAEAAAAAARVAAAEAARAAAMAALEALVSELAACIQKYCSGAGIAETLNTLGLPFPTLDLLRDPAFQPGTDGARNPGVQLMVIDFSLGGAPGIVVPAGPASARVPAVEAPRAVLNQPILNIARLPRWTDIRLDVARQAPSDAAVGVYLTSLGTSTGEAFDLQVVNTTGKSFRLTGGAIVVEPVTAEVRRQIQSRLQRQLAAAGGATTARLSGYCLEFLKQAPSAGDVFRVVGPAVQAQFAPMRRVLEASRRLWDAGALTPDSDPRGYFDFVRQWSIWTLEQTFDETSFTKAFVDHTRKIVESQGRDWNRSIEDILRAAAPNRWRDIQRVLSATGPYLDLSPLALPEPPHAQSRAREMSKDDGRPDMPRFEPDGRADDRTQTNGHDQLGHDGNVERALRVSRALQASGVGQRHGDKKSGHGQEGEELPAEGAADALIECEDAE